MIHKYCKYMAQILHRYNTDITQILYRYCTDIVLPQAQMSNVLMLQRRMVTSLAMYWLLTQRNPTHTFKTMGEPFSLGENHQHKHRNRSLINNNFIRFQCSTTKSSVLKSVTLLDTPGNGFIQNVSICLVGEFYETTEQIEMRI